MFKSLLESKKLLILLEQSEEMDPILKAKIDKINSEQDIRNIDKETLHHVAAHPI